MKQAFLLLAAIFAGLEIGRAALGYEAVLLVVYGAIALMALMISGTFLWLWAERTTPLALGMALSWAGAALFAGWWWLFNLTGGPDWAHRAEAAFFVLALWVVGAVLHFSVIHRSFGLHGASFLWPVASALGLSALIYTLF